MSTFGLSAGVTGREIIRDVQAQPQFGFTGAAVISSKRGTLEPSTVTSERQFVNRYGTPSLDRPSMYAVIRFMRRASQVTVKRVVVDAVSAFAEVGGATDPFLTITAENPGAWGNDVSVRFIQDEDDTSRFTFEVSENGEVAETFEISFDEDAVDGFGQTIYIEDKINRRSNLVRVAVDHTETNDITDGQTVELSNGADDTDPVGDAEVIAGLQDFRNMEKTEVNYFMNAGWISPAIQSEMVAVMEERKDGIVILDMPDFSDPSDLVEFRKVDSNINSSFAAMYAGWVRITDTYTGKEISIPPSGDIAGIYSQTQRQSIWGAPAGLENGIINGNIGLTVKFSEADRNILYPAGINPIQTFPGQGDVVWGQKTQLPFAASLDRVHVRFLMNFVRTTAVASLKPYVFQSNTEFTRNSIFSLLDGFLRDIQANDGANGYRINIGTDLNTADVQAASQLLIEIEIQPTPKSEFIRVDVITVPLSADLS